MADLHRVIWVRQGGHYERSIEVYGDGRLLEVGESDRSTTASAHEITLLDVARLNRHHAHERNLVGEVLAAWIALQPSARRPLARTALVRVLSAALRRLA